jgi:hypothetical protein
MSRSSRSTSKTIPNLKKPFPAEGARPNKVLGSRIGSGAWAGYACPIERCGFVSRGNPVPHLSPD